MTYVTGESPHLSDSGILFARKAKRALGFREQDIVSPDAAIADLMATPGLPLVFVDDFVGSGRQFEATWHRKVECLDGTSRSFADLRDGGQLTQAYYCNAVSTAAGLARIAENCPGVMVLPGNVVGVEASFTDDGTRQWPSQLREIGRRFIAGVAPRCGFLASDGTEEDWRGFDLLGLGLSFSHSTPDATLPIFHSERNGWKPLVRRG